MKLLHAASHNWHYCVNVWFYCTFVAKHYENWEGTLETKFACSTINSYGPLWTQARNEAKAFKCLQRRPLSLFRLYQFWDTSELIQNSVTGAFELQETLLICIGLVSSEFWIPKALYRKANPAWSIRTSVNLALIMFQKLKLCSLTAAGLSVWFIPIRGCKSKNQVPLLHPYLASTTAHQSATVAEKGQAPAQLTVSWTVSGARWQQKD